MTTPAAAFLPRLLVFGPMRSGNVLLQALLTAQPQVAAAPPPDFVLHKAYRMGRRLHEPLSAQGAAYFAHLFQKANAGAAIQGPVPEVRAPTLDTLHAAACQAAATPQTELIHVRMHGPVGYLPALCRSPGLRCICLLRDPRDVMLSRAYRGEFEIDPLLVEWKLFVRVARAAQAEGRALCVRFEDLVREPAATLARIGDYLGTPLDPTASVVRWPDHSSFEPLPDRIEPGVAERWRSRQAESLPRYVGFACAPELRLLGYAPGPRLNAAERARYHARWQLTRVSGALGELRARAKRRAFPALVGR